MSNKATERAIASASAATRRLNPHLWPPQGEKLADYTKKMGIPMPEKETRVRQDPKPLMNKLESDWFANLRRQPEVNQATLRAQAKRYKIGNNAWYKPDMTATHEGRETAWECKGPSQMRGMARGMLTIKVAASQWPEVEFRLVWRQAGRWHQQIILP